MWIKKEADMGLMVLHEASLVSLSGCLRGNNNMQAHSTEEGTNKSTIQSATNDHMVGIQRHPFWDQSTLLKTYFLCVFLIYTHMCKYNQENIICQIKILAYNKCITLIILSCSRLVFYNPSQQDGWLDMLINILSVPLTDLGFVLRCLNHCYLLACVTISQKVKMYIREK